MFNLLHVVTLPPQASREEIGDLAARLAQAGAGFDGVLNSVANPTLPRDLNGGSLMWRMTFATEDEHWAALGSRQWQADVAPLLSPTNGVSFDRVSYRPGLKNTSPGRTKPGIWRCLVLAVDAGTPADTIRQFERDTASMPEHVSAIRNWQLGAVMASAGRRRWSHVWEQEFDDIAGLEGEYMTHPIHWGLVDGWFDPECPQRIVDTLLIHAAMDIDEAVIL
jgi:hypothetical protein